MEIKTWWERLNCTRNPGAHSGEDANADNDYCDCHVFPVDAQAVRRNAATWAARVAVHSTPCFCLNFDNSFPNSSFGLNQSSLIIWPIASIIPPISAQSL